MRLRELAAIRSWFGYRRLHILLKREGVVVNHKKLYRIRREERLSVRKRGGRKRVNRRAILTPDWSGPLRVDTVQGPTPNSCTT